MPGVQNLPDAVLPVEGPDPSDRYGSVQPEVGRFLRGALGAGLAVLGVVPIYRLLQSERTGPAGSATVSLVDIHFNTIWSGLLLILLVAVLGALIPSGIERRVIAGIDVVRRPSLPVFAAVIALLAGVITAAFSLTLLGGTPSHVDSIAQVLHARYWADGRLAGPLADGAFRSMQNALFTEHGWVSQYPPGHVLMLALFFAVGAPWAAGPMAVAITVFFAALTLSRLLPERPLLVRCASCLLALSPFLLFLGASYMNHVTAGAGITIGAYALCRARHGSWSWALSAGAAFGFAFMTRPLSTLTAAAALSLLIPFTVEGRPSPRRMIRVLLITAAGAMPFALLLMAYNSYFFGGPFTFGYTAALGPRAGPGLHVDPWGNVYGLREAVAYTSADLTALGVHLLETPISAILVIGLFLVLARRLTPGERVLVGWAVAPVVTNAMYWHHGLFMGPRMLHEVTAPWVFLFAVAAAFLISCVPRDMQIGTFHPRTGVGAAFAGALALGLLVLAPHRAFSYGASSEAVARMPLPQVQRPSLVFVHEGWSSRIAMTLAAERYRLDAVETLLRQNSTCAVHQLAEAAVSGDETAEQRLLTGLDTVPRSTTLLAEIHIVPGSSFRVQVDETLSPDCVRHAHSDRHGVLAGTPLLWRGDLPGSKAEGILFIRDMGTTRNARALELYPEREPLVYMPLDAAADTAVLLPYREGMLRLWGQDTT